MRAKLFAVITGDIINSSRIKGLERRKLTAGLRALGKKMDVPDFGVVSFEVIRGDSFQLVMKHPENIIRAMLMIRAHFRSIRLEEAGYVDARLGAGIGPIEYKSTSQHESDGSAYRFAAIALEEIENAMPAQMNLRSQLKTVDTQIQALLVAMEFIVSGWTSAQARTMWWSLQSLTQSDISSRIGVTQSTITRTLKSAGERTIQYLLKYGTNLMKEIMPELLKQVNQPSS